MMPDAATLATIASIISGFGITALMFRIQREIVMAERNKQTWVTWADRLLIAAVLISLLLVVLPVLLFPSSLCALRMATSMCVASATLVSGYIPSILAHYGLAFGRARRWINPEPAEEVWVYVTIISSVVLAVVFLLKTGCNQLGSRQDQEINWTAIGSFATASGVIFLAWQIWQTKRQSITAFEDEMSRQYREILKTIPISALLGKELSLEEIKEVENGIYHYLDLSNEQVFLRQNNRVSSETWKSWCDGVKANLSRKAFEEVWKRIKTAAPNNFLELQKLEATNFEGDPREWSDLNKPKHPQ